ncbi:MAG TPA: glycosyltransferase family 87 protein [Acidimicrobiales bacterium]|nr:glycosyltransferase family 87 protein [Acidimicrobiales bacterium]
MAGALRARVVRVVTAWSPQERDAVLYACSALFAVITARTSSIALYRQWGELATVPYAVGGVASALLARRQRHAADPWTPPVDGDRHWHWTTPRMLVFLAVLVGATLMPLSLEILWQAQGGGTTHLQPEVAVVMDSGKRLAHRQDPYQLVDGSRGQVHAPAGQPAYDVYNPYLPLMSLFGLPSSTKAPPRLTDARVAFSLITIVVVIAALALCRGPTGPRLLTLQSMTVLPTAALPLATGGDDLPVVAFLLLGLILAQRRRPLAAGFALGIAASMKITAWPLALLAFLVARDRQGRTGRRPALLLLGGMAAVTVPVILPTALSNVPAFMDNVVRFPLGLAGIRSPAASPLVGHLVVSVFPGAHHLFPLVVAGAGVVALGYVLLRRRPRTPAAVARLVAWAMTVAILLAPATRIGYFLYPIDLFVWAWLLDSEDTAHASVVAVEPPLASVETEAA